MSVPQCITVNTLNVTSELLHRLQWQVINSEVFYPHFQCYHLFFKMMPIFQILCLLHLLLKNSVHKDAQIKWYFRKYNLNTRFYRRTCKQT